MVDSLSSIQLLLSLISACVAGFIVVSYEDLAAQQGWPVGKLFRNNIFRVVFGGLAIIGTVGFSLINFSVVWGVGILIGGFVGAFILSFLFKSFVQWVALFLLAGSLFLQFPI